MDDSQNGSDDRGRRGRVLQGGLLAAALLAAVAYPLVVTNAYLLYAGVLTLMFALTATGWNFMGGFTGYISLGHSAFFGIGAYAAGLTIIDLDWPYALAVVFAAAVVGVLAIAIGYVALRVRGASFVIVTIALVYIAGLIAQGWRGLTGGSFGIRIPTFAEMGRVQSHTFFYYVFLILLVGALALWWYIDRSKYGMGLKAIREDEDKAESLGVPTTAYKLVAFALSASVVGVGGAVYAIWFGTIDPIFVFQILLSANMVLMSLLGGLRFLFGPLIGAMIVGPATEIFLVQLGETQIHLVATGLLLGAVVLFMPDGLIPAVQRLWRRRRPPEASIRETQAGAVDDPVASR